MGSKTSVVISLRIPNWCIDVLDKRAEKRGLSINGYLKEQIIKGCSVNTDGVVKKIEVDADGNKIYE